MAKAKTRKHAEQTAPHAQDLLVLELQEMHSAENQLARVLPRLSKAAQSPALRDMLEQRLEEGERITKDIEAVLEEFDASPGRKKNVAAEGLINDAREHVQELDEGPALDAVLIGAIQKTEHYCIAAWGTARSLAKAVGQDTASRAMEHALKEGSPFEEKPTELAKTEITPALLSGKQAEDEQQTQRTDGQNRRGGGSAEVRAHR